VIRAALEKTGGNQARAARLLGIKHTTLNAKIKRYKIGWDGGAHEEEKATGDHEIAA
jgi:DNA-binding NtrC family response regulator